MDTNNQEVYEEQSAAPRRKKKKKKGWIIFLIILILAVAGGTGFYFMQRQKPISATEDFLENMRAMNFDGMKNLAAGYETDDSIEFLLNLYCIHSETDKCLKLMREYGDRLDGYAKLSLYCRCRDFSSAAALCDEVYESFAPDDAIIAMMAESLINSGEIARAEKLKAALEADVPEYRDARKFRSAVEMTFSSPEYRENVIKNYRYRPPYLTL